MPSSKPSHKHRTETATAAPAVTGPLTIQSSSSLTEDYIQRQDLFLSPGVSTLALYRNPYKGNSIEGGVAVNGEYKTLARDPTSGKWSLDATSMAPGCTEIVSAVELNGDVFTIASTPDNFYQIEITENGPEVAEYHPTCKGAKNLKVTYTPPTPQRWPVVYGVLPDGKLMLLLRVSGSVQTAILSVGDLSGGYVLGSYNRLSHVLMTVVNGHLTWWTINIVDDFRFQLGGPWSEPDTAVRQVIIAYQSDANSIEFVALRSDNQLCLARQRSDGGFALEPIGNINAVSAAGVRDAESMMHIYLIDADDKLSVLRQTGWDTEGTYKSFTPIFSGATLNSGENVPVAIPLASGASSVTVDQFPVDHPVLTVFAAAGGGGQGPAPVRLIGQDAVTLRWWDESVQLVAAQFYKISRWHTRAKLVDSLGNPVPLYDLSLHSETTCTVDVGATTYPLGPHLPAAPVQTDLRGLLVFASQALGLTTPSVTISAEAMPTSKEIRPDARVQSYLAGMGKLPFKPDFSGATLKGATVNGRLLVPAHVWQQGTDDGKTVTPDQIVTVMQTLIGMADPELPDPQFPSFVLQNYDSDRPILALFRTQAEFELARARIREHPQFGGWWDDVTDFADDVWQGIRAGTAKIVEIAKGVGNDLVDFAIKIGETIYKLPDIAIQTLADAYHAVESVFNWLEAGAKATIDWLKGAFRFKDYCNTKSAIDEALTLLQPNLIAIITDAHQYFNKAFLDTLPARIDEAFAALGDRYDNVIFGDLKYDNRTPSFLVRAGQTVLYIERLAEMIIDPIVNFVWDHFINRWLGLMANALPAPLFASMEPLLKPMSDLFDAFNQFLQQFETILGEIFSWVKAKVTGDEGAESFKNTLFMEFVRILHQISLSCAALLHNFIDAMYRALTAAVGMLDKMLNAEIDLGIIGEVWGLFQSGAGVAAEDQTGLTLGGLFSLIIAAPATILYKLIFGADRQPFPNGRLPIHPIGGLATDTKAGDALVAVGASTAILNSELQFICDSLGLLAAYRPVTNQPALDRVMLGLSSGKLGLTIVELLFDWPTKSKIPGPPDLDTPGERAAFAHWLIGYGIQVLFDFGTMVLTTYDRTKKTFIPRQSRALQFDDPVGLLLASGLGVATYWSGLIESALADETGAQWSANLLQPTAYTFLYLRSRLVAEANPELLPYIAGVKGVTDIASLCGSALRLSFMPSLNDPAATAASAV